MQMEALLLNEYRNLEMVSMVQPSIGPIDVLIRVSACGICGSDVHGYDGSSGRRRPPIVMGHEAAGVVEAFGDAVDCVAIGDHVTFDSTISCGKCDECNRGNPNRCPNRRVFGVSCDEYRQHGAFAEYIAVPQHILYPLPIQLPLTHATFIEPTSVALHAISRLKVVAGEKAVVVGTGIIGLLVIQALKVVGCSEIVGIDRDLSRLQLARKLGATQVVHAAQEELVAVAIGQVGGSADIAIDAVGSSTALRTSIGCVRRGGRVCLIGNARPKVELPLQVVVADELTLIGSCASAGEYPRAIELLTSGEISVAPLISAVAPLSDGPHWFERLHSCEPGLMKVILVPTGPVAT